VFGGAGSKTDPSPLDGGLLDNGSSFWLSLFQALMKVSVRALVGDMKFSALVLRGREVQYGEENTNMSERSTATSQTELKLWGLTLGMTLDLLSHMQPHLLRGHRGGTSLATTPASLRSRSSPAISREPLKDGRRQRSASSATAAANPNLYDSSDEVEVESIWTPSMAYVSS